MSKSLKLTKAQAKELALARQQEIDEFVEHLVAYDGKVPLKGCFLAATDIAAYLTAVKNKNIVYATRFTPRIVNSLVDKALEGNLDAIKMFFEFIGAKTSLEPQGKGSPTVATQINVNSKTLKDIVRVGEDGTVVIDVEAEEGELE